MRYNIYLLLICFILPHSLYANDSDLRFYRDKVEKHINSAYSNAKNSAINYSYTLLDELHLKSSITQKEENVMNNEDLNSLSFSSGISSKNFIIQGGIINPIKENIYNLSGEYTFSDSKINTSFYYFFAKKSQNKFKGAALSINYKFDNLTPHITVTRYNKYYKNDNGEPLSKEDKSVILGLKLDI